MVKLADNEIQEKLEEENGSSEVLDVPSGAWSKFRFRIEENIEDLVTLITEMPKKEISYKMLYDDGSVYEDKEFAVWKTSVKEKEDGSVEYSLHDTSFPAVANVNVNPDGDEMKIETFGGYIYTIKQDEKGGCAVEFDGPINGLLSQNLLPPMTYVSGTLEGKFVKDGEDLTDYMAMDIYGLLRQKKNENFTDMWGDKYTSNPQDVFGAAVNSRLNNEVPFFNRSAKLLVYEVDEFLSEVKGEKREAIQKQVEKYKEDKGNSVVSPEVGAEIKQRMLEEMQNKR